MPRISGALSTVSSKIFADRLAVDQRQRLARIAQHGRAAGRIERVERVAPFPWVLAHELERDPLFAQGEADLAAERTKGKAMQLPHGGSPCRKARGASTARLGYIPRRAARPGRRASPLSKSGESCSLRRLRLDQLGDGGVIEACLVHQLHQRADEILAPARGDVGKRERRLVAGVLTAGNERESRRAMQQRALLVGQLRRAGAG